MKTQSLPWQLKAVNSKVTTKKKLYCVHASAVDA